jgi:inner membrane transporter RhtA
MLALRQMTPSAFGTRLALEAAIGLTLGLLLLHQVPPPGQCLGISLVVLAGGAAQRGGRRHPPPTIDDTTHTALDFIAYTNGHRIRPGLACARHAAFRAPGDSDG